MRHAIAIALVVIVIMGLTIWVCEAMRQRDLASARVNRQWQKYAFEHCRVISVSAGGFASPGMVAYRCEDGHDHVSYNGLTPKTWMTP